jgi:hypothetical protein
VSERLKDLVGIKAGMLRALETAQQQRPNRSVAEWIVFERATLAAEINKRREFLGKRPVSCEDVERIEHQAVGHSDYSSKLALYCAQMVLDP